jgi:hypothetical protein
MLNDGRPGDQSGAGEGAGGPENLWNRQRTQRGWADRSAEVVVYLVPRAMPSAGV